MKIVKKTAAKTKIKILIGLSLGAVAGIIDVIPMIMQKLSWDANLSAFSMWVISGFIISTSYIKINSAIKGILISFLLAIPSAILVGWKEPISLIPMSIAILVLGSSLGFAIDKIEKHHSKLL